MNVNSIILPVDVWEACRGTADACCDTAGIKGGVRVADGVALTEGTA